MLRREYLELLLRIKINFHSSSNFLNILISEPELIKSFIKLPDSIITKNKLRQVFYGLPDNDFDIIYKSIKKYLQNNVNVHSYKLPNLYYDINYDVLEEHYARVIEGLFNIGKISHNSIETYIDEIEEIVDAEYDEVVSANPRLKDVLPENILSITSKKISNEFLCEYLSVNVFLEFSFFPINLFKNLFKKFLFIEGVRAKQEIVYTKENSPGFFDLLDLAYKEGFQNFNKNDELVINGHHYSKLLIMIKIRS